MFAIAAWSSEVELAVKASFSDDAQAAIRSCMIGKMVSRMNGTSGRPFSFGTTYFASSVINE